MLSRYIQSCRLPRLDATTERRPFAFPHARHHCDFIRYSLCTLPKPYLTAARYVASIAVALMLSCCCTWPFSCHPNHNNALEPFAVTGGARDPRLCDNFLLRHRWVHQYIFIAEGMEICTRYFSNIKLQRTLNNAPPSAHLGE